MRNRGAWGASYVPICGAPAVWLANSAAPQILHSSLVSPLPPGAPNREDRSREREKMSPPSPPTLPLPTESTRLTSYAQAMPAAASKGIHEAERGPSPRHRRAAQVRNPEVGKRYVSDCCASGRPCTPGPSRPQNMLEWHFVIKGPIDTPYRGGSYHGKLIFPSEYPYKPPAIMMLTPK